MSIFSPFISVHQVSIDHEPYNKVYSRSYSLGFSSQSSQTISSKSSISNNNSNNNNNASNSKQNAISINSSVLKFPQAFGSQLGSQFIKNSMISSFLEVPAQGLFYGQQLSGFSYDNESLPASQQPSQQQVNEIIEVIEKKEQSKKHLPMIQETMREEQLYGNSYVTLTLKNNKKITNQDYFLEKSLKSSSQLDNSSNSQFQNSKTSKNSQFNDSEALQIVDKSDEKFCTIF